MSKSFQKRWRKRNGKGCTYAHCDCVGPMSCEHGETRAANLVQTSVATPTMATPTQGTLLTTKHDDSHKYTKWWKANTHKCEHYGDKLLFRINDSEIYASTIGRAARDRTAKLVLQCAEPEGFEPSITKLPAGFESLQAHTHKPPPTIVLPWPDYGLPPVYRSFWAELIKLLPPGRVVVACQGSHGRTGTALAALLITHMHMSATEAVEYVRRVHCDEAVESHDQMEYLGLLAKWDTGELATTRV